MATVATKRGRGTQEEDIFTIPDADGIGQPPLPPGRGNVVGADFPEGDHERYIIKGQPVTSYTLKMTEGGREVHGVVFIETADASVREFIQESLTPAAQRTVSETPPKEFAAFAESGKQGLYVLDTSPLMSADTLHEIIRGDLKYMAMQSSLLSKVTARSGNAPRENNAPGIEDTIVKAAVDAFKAAHPDQPDDYADFTAELRQSLSMSAPQLEKTAKTLKQRPALLPAAKAAYMLGTVPLESVIKHSYHDIWGDGTDHNLPSNAMIRDQGKFYTQLHQNLLMALETHLGEDRSQDKKKGGLDF